MQRVTSFIFLIILSACHAQAPRVRCDSKLQPINAPAPMLKLPATTSTTP